MNKILLPLCLAAGLLSLPLAAHAQKVAPKPVSMPSPGYPDALTDTGLSGQAEVDATIKADGSVADAQLAMATHRAFGRAALAAIATWRFEPGTQDGTPVDVKVTIPFVFTAPFEQQVNAMAKRKVFAALAEPALSLKDYGAKLKVKKNATPNYPRTVSGERSDEKVQVDFVVAADGTTLNPKIVGTPRKEFIAPAIQAIAFTTYEPPVKAGKAVYVETSTTLRFTDERPERGGGEEGGGRRRGGGGGGGFGGGGGGGGGGGFGGGD